MVHQIFCELLVDLWWALQVLLTMLLHSQLCLFTSTTIAYPYCTWSNPFCTSPALNLRSLVMEGWLKLADPNCISAGPGGVGLPMLT